MCIHSELAFKDIQTWYDGYILNSTHIYNPKSVIEAIRRKRIGNYWVQSETYESLKLYIELNEDGLKEAIVQMLGGAYIKIDVTTFQNDMTTIKSRDDVLTLLVHLGYLAYDIDHKSVFIPNEEIVEEFVRAITTGKNYPQIIKDYGGTILLVGINYDTKNKKHTCKIEEYRK